jgi:hypothetical protein
MKTAGAPAKPKRPPLRMTVSAELFAYLEWLMRNTLLGDTPNEVASYLLRKRLEEMRQSDYHEEPLIENAEIVPQGVV